jgi:geranylgeranyl pyrophosphate synthase
LPTVGGCTNTSSNHSPRVKNKSAMLQERKEKMLQTKRLVLQEYKVFKSLNNISCLFQSGFFKLLTKRMNRIGIRGTFSRLMYEHVSKVARSERLNLSKDKETILFFQKQLPFIAEAIITVQYYHNYILDGKGGLADQQGFLLRDKVNETLIDSNLLKDALYDYIDYRVFLNNPDKARLVRTKVRQIFKLVDIGQKIQMDFGTISQYESDLASNPIIINCALKQLDERVLTKFEDCFIQSGMEEKNRTFLRNYLIRVQLSNAVLFRELTNIIIDVLGYNGQHSEYLKSFSIEHGMLGQLINDNNDFSRLTTATRKYDDVFSDIKNDVLTLPLLCFLNKKSQLNDWEEVLIAYKEMKNKILNPKTEKETLGLLLPHIKKSISIVSEISTHVKITFLEKYKSFDSLLGDMMSVSVVNNNRFYLDIFSIDSETSVSDTGDANRLINYSSRQVSIIDEVHYEENLVVV